MATDNTFLRAFCSLGTMNEDGLHTGGISGFLKSVGYAIKLLKPERCVIVFDGPGGSLKRRKIYPEYKDHKKTKIRLNRIYEDDIGLDGEEKNLKKQLQRLVSYLSILPVHMLSLDHVEADDTMAYCALDCFKNWGVYLMSSDKDFLQLVDDRVKVWSPTRKKLYSPQDVLNEYGIHPKNFVIYRALDGDTSDNIPGVKGCGLKTIIKYFPFLSEDRKVEVSEVLKHCEKNINSGKKIYQKILDNKSDVDRNFELMQLVDTAIQTHAQLKVNEILDTQKPKMNRYEFITLMSEDKMLNNIPNSNFWLNEVFTKLDYFIK